MDCNACKKEEISCNSCSSDEVMTCPLCNQVGFTVHFETVENLVEPSILDDVKYYSDENFYLCKSRSCQVSYYTSEGARLFIDQLQIPIWYKGQHNPENYLVCYCRKITLKNVIEAVNDISGNVTDVGIKDVCRYLNKPIDHGNCLYHNPMGKCCTPLFINAIQYARTQFK